MLIRIFFICCCFLPTRTCWCLSTRGGSKICTPEKVHVFLQGILNSPCQTPLCFFSAYKDFAEFTNYYHTLPHLPQLPQLPQSVVMMS